MSTSTLVPESLSERIAEPHAADPGLAPLGPITSATAPSAALPDDVKNRLVGGTSVLGMGVMIERGSGFLANILAARFAGTSSFGAYSLAISTANQISTYAAGGIGATATRFSGKYPYASRGYTTLARVLAIVSVVSAILAASALWLGAGPIAHLLGRQQLSSLLHWAVLSAAGMILLECARGFFVGQRRLHALLLLSMLVGGSMIILLPLAARTHSATRMITLQGATTTLAVIVCLLLARPLRLHAPANAPAPLPLRPMLKEVWTFGGVQLAGLVASNLAGWWLMTLVARSDTSLVQMSFFAIASQWRNLASIAPSLLTEGSYAVMAEADGEASATPQRVFALCSFASLAVSLTLAAIGILVVPWVLTLLYGKAYAPAGVAVAVALAIAVVHMGNAPAAARLTIVSIRATGVINTLWAVFVAAAATLLLFHGGSAWQAMAIFFTAHVLSSALVLLTLQRKDTLPAGLGLLFTLGFLSSGLLATLAVLRSLHPTLTALLSLAMLAVLGALLAGLYLLGRRFRWLPSASALNSLTLSLRSRLPRRLRHV